MISNQYCGFVNKCNCIFEADLLRKAYINKFGTTPKNARIRLDSQGYPCVSIYYYKKRHDFPIHRLIKSYVTKHEWGFELCSKDEVHHVNYNKLDARIQNLIVVSHDEHIAIHQNDSRSFLNMTDTVAKDVMLLHFQLGIDWNGLNEELGLSPNWDCYCPSDCYTSKDGKVIKRFWRHL